MTLFSFLFFSFLFYTMYPPQVREVRGGHAGHRAGRGHLHRGAAGDRPQPQQRGALLRGLPQVTRDTCPGSASPPAMSGTSPRRWCRAARAAASPCAAPPAPWRPSTAAWSAACSSAPGPASTSGEQRKILLPTLKIFVRNAAGEYEVARIPYDAVLTVRLLLLRELLQLEKQHLDNHFLILQQLLLLLLLRCCQNFYSMFFSISLQVLSHMHHIFPST